MVATHRAESDRWSTSCRRAIGALSCALAVAAARPVVAANEPPPPPRSAPQPPYVPAPAPPQQAQPPVVYVPATPVPVVVAAEPPPPLPIAMRVIYAPFYAAGLAFHYGFYYVIVAPLEVLGRTLSYGVDGGVEREDQK